MNSEAPEIFQLKLCDFRITEAAVTMFNLSLSILDPVVATFAVLVTMAIFCCLCCVCIKLSDMKLKQCIVEMSQQKGVPVDIEKLESKPVVHKEPVSDETCAIVVPDLGIVVAF